MKQQVQSSSLFQRVECLTSNKEAKHTFMYVHLMCTIITFHGTIQSLTFKNVICWKIANKLHVANFHYRYQLKSGRKKV